MKAISKAKKRGIVKLLLRRVAVVEQPELEQKEAPPTSATHEAWASQKQNGSQSKVQSYCAFRRPCTPRRRRVACAAPPHVGWVCDAALIAPARRAAFEYIEGLVGDLATNSERYGVVDRDSGDFVFVPDWFLAPRVEALVMARKLAHTQMLCSCVAERRSASASSAPRLGD